MAEFKIIRLRVQREGLSSIIDSVVEGLNLGEGVPLKLQLVNVLFSEHGPSSGIEEVPPVDEVDHPSSARGLFGVVALLAVRLELKKEVSKFHSANEVPALHRLRSEERVKVGAALPIVEVCLLGFCSK